MCFKSHTLFVRAAVLSLALGVSVFTLAQDSSQSGSSAGSAQSGSSQGASKSKKSRTSASSSDQGASSSEAQSASGSSSSGKLSAADKKFVMDAAHGGLAEVQLGQLAASKGTNDEVKQFGQKMVDDHSKANEELKSLAEQKGVTLPTDLKPADKQFHDKLDKLSGAAFDKAYMQYMVMDHKKDVAEFKKEAKTGKDSDVKAWAEKTAPTLEGHLDTAQKTASKVGASSGAKKSESATQ
jgi:putative membrane protein